MDKAYSVTNAGRWLPILAGALVLAAQPAVAQERTCEVAEVAGEASLTHDGSRGAADVGAATSRQATCCGPAPPAGSTSPAATAPV